MKLPDGARKKSQQMTSRTSKKVHYYSCQVSKDPCTCRSIFGADAHHSVIPTCSALWTSGDEFKKRFHVILQGNSASFGGHDILPVWFEKTWQVLWNRNEHNRDHGTSPHCDHCKTYSDTGPITSFSFGCGGILTLTSQTSCKGASKMLFQEHGDVLIMAGKFQKDFFHGVPERRVWRDLCAGHGSGFVSMEDWEKKGVQREKALHENMVVRLANVLAPHLGLVKDKLAVVVKVDLHHADQQMPKLCSSWNWFMLTSNLI